MVSLPEVMTKLLGEVLAGMLARFTCHLPVPAAAVVETFWLWKLTVTVAPGAAVPKTGTGMLRCKTALLLKRLGTVRTAALAFGSGRFARPPKITDKLTREVKTHRLYFLK